jgi:hypothetical protein
MDLIKVAQQRVLVAATPASGQPPELAALQDKVRAAADAL